MSECVAHVSEYQWYCLIFISEIRILVNIRFKTLLSDHSFDFCVRCSSKYNRIRPSLCQYKHCSWSFCFDCMKDHNDDIQQSFTQDSDKLNEIK